MHCTDCGFAMGPLDTECARCKLQGPPPPAVSEPSPLAIPVETPNGYTCPRCGNALQSGALFCHTCGLRLASAVPRWTPLPLQPSVPMPPTYESAQPQTQAQTTMAVFSGIILAVIVIGIALAMINSANQEAEKERARIDICQRQGIYTQQGIQGCIAELKREGY